MYSYFLKLNVLHLMLAALLLLLIPTTVKADCQCHIEFNNGFDNFDGSVDENSSVTIKKIKTAKQISGGIYGTYKTQWTGTRKIYSGGDTVFKFNVDFCSNGYQLRFIRKDGKKCTKQLGNRGTKSNPVYVLCDSTDWR